jgi:hypothetical protein
MLVKRVRSVVMHHSSSNVNVLVACVASDEQVSFPGDCIIVTTHLCSNPPSGAAASARPNVAAGQSTHLQHFSSVAQNNPAQALAADTVFYFGRGSKGDYVRLEATHAPCAAVCSTHSTAASDGSCSNDFASERSNAHVSTSLRILQLIEVKHPASYVLKQFNSV